MHQGVIIEDEGLQVHQSPHLWGQTVQLVVTEVQIQQISQIDEQLIGNVVNAAENRKTSVMCTSYTPVPVIKGVLHLHLFKDINVDSANPAFGIVGQAGC